MLGGWLHMAGKKVIRVSVCSGLPVTRILSGRWRHLFVLDNQSSAANWQLLFFLENNYIGTDKLGSAAPLAAEVIKRRL